MRIGGVIAEYNPFHEGHRYQLTQMRKSGLTHIAVAMSGNYVQRGDLALFSKWTRAQAALQNGADLVIELPTPYAMAPANDFARAGVYLLSQLQVETLSFGSEIGQIEPLALLAEALEKLEQSHPEQWQQYLKSGYSHAKARELLLKEHVGKEAAALITQPNNLLGISYIRAANAMSLPLRFHTIARKEAAHDQSFADGKIASASFLREALLTDPPLAANFLPSSAWQLYQQELTQGNAPFLLSKIYREMFSYLRRFSAEEFAQIKDISPEMANRLAEQMRTAPSFVHLQESLICKQYSRARIRRILLNCFLKIQKNHFPSLPEYIRILGMNQKGEEILKHAAPTIPVSGRMKPLTEQFATAAFEVDATDLYTMAGKEILPKGMELTSPLIRIPQVDK